MKICIVGGVAGGASAATRLRRLDEQAEIIIFERGPYISYANCGLPYYISGTIKNKESLIVVQPKLLKDRFNIDVRTMNEVISIDKENKTIDIFDKNTKEKYTESYDKLLLSPGASPKNIFPNKEKIEGIFTVRNVPNSVEIKKFIEEQRPERAVVIGGGFIGIEMAENLQKAGLDVTIVEYSSHIIASIDREIANVLHSHLKEQGVSIKLNTGVTEMSKTENGLQLNLGDKGKIYADMVIMSVGVQPESSLAKEAGLELGMRNSIAVNEFMQTSDNDIFAVGDAVNIVNGITKKEGLIPLAGPANKQGRAVASNILGDNIKANITYGCSVLKVFDFTAASTGMTEESLKQTNISYKKIYATPHSHANYYPGATSIIMKLLYNNEGKILGAQAVGRNGVEKRIDVISTTMQLGGTVFDLANLELSYAPPFSSAKDPVNMLGYIAENEIKNISKIFYPEELNNIDTEKCTILDSRFDEELIFGKILNSIHIPTDELRYRFNELDKSKPIYVFCQIGLRGNVALRFLIQHGFEAYNMTGGYEVYSLINDNTTEWIAEKVDRSKNIMNNTSQENNTPINADLENAIQIDACGLQCPGPIMKLAENMKSAKENATLQIHATDPAFATDAKVWCERTGNTFIGVEESEGLVHVTAVKGCNAPKTDMSNNISSGNDKSMVVFSGDLDKAIASFIIANGAASMGRKVTMFFTFWGLNILRKSEKTIGLKKNFIEKMFGKMMPRGAKKLGLSKMNMGGAGASMIRNMMKKKNVNSLDELIQSALDNGVKIVACQMSMDLMGIQKEELLDGVELGGVATFLGAAETSDTNLFI